ncbi:MAG: hypothetical protein Q9186_001908 [Xanthomendoza sp. 1 TL-2023]
MNGAAMPRSNAVNQQQQPDIWAQMSYIPPRGPCSQKLSLLSTCPCFRFMIHPLKASTSFECDGCGHHASFHKMDNHQDDETVRRWKTDQEDRIVVRRKIMTNMDVRAAEAGVPHAQAGAQQSQRRLIENPDRDSRSIEYDESPIDVEVRTRGPEPVRKKRRTAGG